MSDHASDHGRHSADDQRPDEAPESGSIEAYESEGKVVLYDAENPLAWVETTRAVPLREVA